MFEGFEPLAVDTDMARIVGRHGGKGPPLLLLHGNPMNHVSWHNQVGELARCFHVVATDLRGYGDSSAPPAGENFENYSFRAMANDQVTVMKSLGYDSFFVAGHDRGARTAHRMAIDHPDKVKRIALLDILPSHHIWTNTSREWANSSWHWTFMVQPEPLPETMMGAVPARWFMEQKLSKKGIGLDFMDPRAFDEYVRCFTEKTIRGSCNDYRACISCDFEMDTADFEAGNLIQMPTLVIWGSQSHTGKVYGDILPIWRQYATNVTGGPIECGHYVPEHAPGETLDRLMAFFSNQDNL
ncbi:MAG: alpha/beta hydrolase [Burkholderiaceae bacterium]